jgi:environmental stress-induced protein Ves
VSGLLLIAVDDRPPQPWRNGGGVTRELFTWSAADADPAGPWQLRLSVADITRDGPFSAFPGVDRWFAVLQGGGVRLALPGRPACTLTPDSDPLHFAGEAAPACALLAGATRDLNLMVQRAAGQGSMQRVAGARPWLSAAPLRALFTTEPLHLQTDDGPAIAVPAWTLAIHTDAAGQRWATDAKSARPAAWWLAFAAHAAASSPSGSP